jgi:5-methylcytosine-specific restriction endonuclease McrA
VGIRIARLAIDIRHFDRFAGRRGKAFGGVPPAPLKDILVVDRPFKSDTLRRRLISEGIKEYRCESCDLTEWMGRPKPLELDHINGQRNDNRLENLRILCPNCHSETRTYRGRNIGLQ